MPYAVAAIGILSFLAGLAVTGGRFVTAGFLVAAAAAVGLWLRWFVISSLEHAFDEGAGYGVSTRQRIRELSLREVTEVSQAVRDRWLNDS